MQALIFLIKTLFVFYTMVILFRFLLQWVRADFYNPLSQFTVKLTNPVLMPMRKIIPGYGGVDNASLVFAALIILAKILIINTFLGYSFGVLEIAIFTIWGVVHQLITLVLGITIIGAILSWVGGAQANPMANIFYQVSDPFIRPIRKLVPPIGGLDLSPMLLIIFIYFILMLIADLFPILDAATKLY